MTTLVIGANGQIGRQVCAIAHRQGHPIRAMIRSAEQRDWFEQQGIETVVADLEEDFASTFEGCDQVLFTAGSGPNTGPDKTLLIDLYAATRVADEASRQGLDRMLMVSAMRAEQPLQAPEKLRPYMAAKFAADAYLRSSKVDHVIVKPGRLTDDDATGRVATSLDETGGNNQISRANVAQALVYLLGQRKIRNHETVLLDGEREIAEALGD